MNYYTLDTIRGNRFGGRMTRFAWTWMGLWLALAVSGCAGNLNDPDAFLIEGPGEKDAETILAESCGTSGCHDDSSQAQAGLDLVSPGVEARVVNINAIAIGCTDRILVVAGDPNASYLIEKVENIPGICGLQMPIIGSLDPDEVEVLREWIIDLGG